MARRVRQHVNPLGAGYIEPRAQPIPWPSHLPPDAPLEVELGCAEAQFCFQLARACPDRRVVGLDIREKLIVKNRRRAAEEGLANLAFGYVNLSVDLDRVFPTGSVHRFHVLFPDPWFKARHRKRRVIGDASLAVMRAQLVEGGELHFATDVWDVALDAMAQLEHPDAAELGLRNLRGPWSFWRGNPFPAQSRREDTTIARGQRVWRMRYEAGASASISGR
jgi:tRNA (guanine-N7-)-methyltransferase